MKKLFIIAGELSGDKHGANLVHSLRKRSSEPMEFRGIGGDMLAEAGVELIEHIRNTSFLGLWEVIRNMGKIRSLFQKTRQSILEFKPDALLLIDYPGFNLKMASFAKKHGIPVIYYICPQVWAWGQHRVHRMKKIIDLFLVILPFEKEFYAKFGITAHFVGHPSLQSVKPAFETETFLRKFGIPGQSVRIGLLPGSRMMEIRSLLPVMKDAAKILNQDYSLHFLLGLSPGIPETEAALFVKEIPNVTILPGMAYDVMAHSHLVWVASGTASLETAITGTPAIVLYKVSPITFAIGKRVVKVPFISLPNLILSKQVYPELVQHDCTNDRLIAVTKKWLSDPGQFQTIRKELTLVKKLLDNGNASDNAAMHILTFFAERR